MRRFYDELPLLPRQRWPEFLQGVGFNFEHYDALFALMAANVQLSVDALDYSARYRAMQALLQPFCSEFGIEAGRPLSRTHRELYAGFYEAATGAPLPERYARGDANAWLVASRRWAARMSRRLDRAAVSRRDLARYSVGYHWAVEHLSVCEFDLMRVAWAKLGVRADYLDAHCAVEDEHADWATRAVLALAAPGDPVIVRAVRDHEDDLRGFYEDITLILRQSHQTALV